MNKGNGKLAVKRTAYAFQHAQLLGVDIIEMDVLRGVNTFLRVSCFGCVISFAPRLN